MTATDRRVTVTSQEGGYRNLIVNTRGHTAIADEPSSLGGSDQGFGPFELLCASLGACTSITLVMYARRKAWPLQDVRVELEYVRAGEQDRPGNGPDLIRRSIRLFGDLTAEQRERLGEIAARCPVAKTLRGTSIEILDQIFGEP